jgi:hypothetical protein
MARYPNCGIDVAKPDKSLTEFSTLKPTHAKNVKPASKYLSSLLKSRAIRFFLWLENNQVFVVHFE